EVGQALLNRYAARFVEALEEIDRDVPDARAKLEAYADLYAGVLRNERMCMCGILAAEYQTLPEAMQSEVIRFFDENEKWLAKVLDEGRANGTLTYSGRTADVAQGILSTLEGAMLVARPSGDMKRFHAAAQQLLTGPP